MYNSTRKHRYNSRELKWKKIEKGRRLVDPSILSGIGCLTLNYRVSLGALGVVAPQRLKYKKWCEVQWLVWYPTLSPKSLTNFLTCLLTLVHRELNGFFPNHLQLNTQQHYTRIYSKNNFQTHTIILRTHQNLIDIMIKTLMKHIKNLNV